MRQGSYLPLEFAASANHERSLLGDASLQIESHT